MQSIELMVLSYEELETLERNIAKERERRLEQERAELFKQAEALATRHGISVDEILAAPARKKRTTAQPKYRNPDNYNETWHGRGKRPAWLTKKLESGFRLEDLAIK